MKTFLTALFSTLLAIHGAGQGIPSPPEIIKGVNIGMITTGSLPKILREASGLEMAGGVLWTHNDDRFAVIYALDTAGNIVGTIHLNHPNNGWEDLTFDAKGNLYIGSFGNNRNNRKNLAIYKLPDPKTITDQVVNAEVIGFHYPDQYEFPPPESKRNFDADAFVSMGDSLYLFTKNRTNPFTGFTRVYRLPQVAGSHEAVLCDSIFLGKGEMIDHWVTSADLSPDGKWLALLSHDRMWIISGFKNGRFSDGKIFQVNLPHFSHKAGLCFSSNSKVYVVDELEFGFLGGKIYAMELAPLFKLLGETMAGVPINTAENALRD